jgi:hypothetical protein
MSLLRVFYTRPHRRAPIHSGAGAPEWLRGETVRRFESRSFAHCLCVSEPVVQLNPGPDGSKPGPESWGRGPTRAKGLWTFRAQVWSCTATGSLHKGPRPRYPRLCTVRRTAAAPTYRRAQGSQARPPHTISRATIRSVHLPHQIAHDPIDFRRKSHCISIRRVAPQDFSLATSTLQIWFSKPNSRSKQAPCILVLHHISQLSKYCSYFHLAPYFST